MINSHSNILISDIVQRLYKLSKANFKMSLWLILVTLPASFFRILCCVFPTSVWTRCMKNRITHLEPHPNQVISDGIDTKDEICDDSCSSSITNRPQSDILNPSSVTCEKNEKSNEDGFYSESSINKQNVIVANSFEDKTNELKRDDQICVSAHQTSTISLPQKAVSDKINVITHSNSILTKDKNSDNETNDKIADSGSDDEITNEEFADKITDGESDDKITDGESCDKITDGESGDKITHEKPGDKIIDEKPGDKIADEKSGVKINNIESGDQITYEESSDKITGRQFESQTTDTLDTNNDNGVLNNKFFEHECCYDAKKVIDEECSNTSNVTILPNCSEIDGCQRTSERYFVYKNEILDVENFCTYSNLDIPEDKSAQMCEDFHISTTNEIDECEFYPEIKENVSIITHENSGGCISDELKPGVCEMNNSYKCSLDIIPMEFIYPCLPHSMYNC